MPERAWLVRKAVGQAWGGRGRTKEGRGEESDGREMGKGGKEN